MYWMHKNDCIMPVSCHLGDKYVYIYIHTYRQTYIHTHTWWWLRSDTRLWLWLHSAFLHRDYVYLNVIILLEYILNTCILISYCGTQSSSHIIYLAFIIVKYFASITLIVKIIWKKIVYICFTFFWWFMLLNQILIIKLFYFQEIMLPCTNQPFSLHIIPMATQAVMLMANCKPTFILYLLSHLQFSAGLPIHWP